MTKEKVGESWPRRPVAGSQPRRSRTKPRSRRSAPSESPRCRRPCPPRAHTHAPARRVRSGAVEGAG
eukprot:9011344-Alexandrium_andersonii.AAC.1